MASRTTHGVKSLNRELVAVTGSFAPAGGSAPTSVKGKGFTVAYTTTGVFTLTFADKYADLVTANATLQLATAADSQVQVGTYTAASKTLVLNVLTAGSLANISANANNRINFTVLFRNSSIE